MSPNFGESSSLVLVECLLVWKGCPLLGASTSQRCAVQNNVEYVVEEVGDGFLILEGGKELTLALALHAMRPTWARTYASVQGTEFHEKDSVRMWDTRNSHLMLKTLYVGISRCKLSAQLHVT